MVVAGSPYPAVLEIGEAFDGFFAVSERVDGEYLDELTDKQLPQVLPALFTALDAAREVDLSATTGYGPWDANETAPHPSWRAALLDVVNGPAPRNRIPRWRERLVASPTGSGPFDEAYRHLRELTDHEPAERHLIHSDLLNRNVLVSGNRLSALLDWGNSMYGDFLYDVAWFCFWAPWYPKWQGVDFHREAARHYDSIGLDVPHLEERLRACQVHIGLDGQAYNAYKERWQDVETIAERTLAIARGAH